MESLVLDSEQRNELIDRHTRPESPLKTKGLTDDVAKLTGRMLELEQRMAGMRGGGGAVRVLSGPWAGPDPFAGDAFASRLKMVQDGQGSTGRIMLPGHRPEGGQSARKFPAEQQPVNGHVRRRSAAGPDCRSCTAAADFARLPAEHSGFGKQVRIRAAVTDEQRERSAGRRRPKAGDGIRRRAGRREYRDRGALDPGEPAGARGFAAACHDAAQRLGGRRAYEVRNVADFRQRHDGQNRWAQ